MKKPHLEILGGDGNIPLSGYCSACTDVKFLPTVEPMNHHQQKQRLQGLFNAHFAKVHLHEDASQAAARIVREATKD